MNIKIISKKISSILKKKIVIEAIKYLIVGGICTVLDFLLLFVLKDNLHINYILAATISFSASVILNYFLCTFWIFKTRVLKSRKSEFLVYIMISMIGLFINISLIWLFTELLRITVLFSKALGTPVVLLWNFLARKFLLHTIKIK